jgi:predicted small lipoprotein YifL
MMMNKTRAANIVLATMAALLFTACGLKDDLYIPTEETEVAPADAQSAEGQSTDGENTEEDPGQLSEQAP